MVGVWCAWYKVRGHCHTQLGNVGGVATGSVCVRVEARFRIFGSEGVLSGEGDGDVWAAWDTVRFCDSMVWVQFVEGLGRRVHRRGYGCEIDETYV